MGFGAVLGDIEAEAARREPSDRLDHGVGGHHPVALRRDEVDARVEQLLLRVQHVQGGALPTRASSRTPVSATSAACTWAWAAMICALAASSVPQAETIAARIWSRLRSTSIRRCPTVSLAWRTRA